MSDTTLFDLTEPPPGARASSVEATAASIQGRTALRVALREDVARHGSPGVDFVDRPTFLRIPADFRDGTLEVDVLGRVGPQAPPDARGFAGLAYRIVDEATAPGFECVYLRPTNGRRADPPAVRIQRAVQYFAFPGYPFDRLRQEHPGRYESAADIGPDQWAHLRLDVQGTTVVVSVDGAVVLEVDDGLRQPASGDVGLFVDIGTEAFFSNLRVGHSRDAHARP